jgi:hypothetical protein
MSKPTRKAYEEHLNEIGVNLSDEDFIIGGKKRTNKYKYGKYLRKYDPQQFETTYHEYVRKNSRQW